ncbi:MAG: thioesterase [Actinomycetia bacterium]|nr:thioesterase [Actinomycetes bacterium]
MTPEEISTYFRTMFPDADSMYAVESAGDRGAVVRLNFDADHHVRPGNTVAGPALMALADVAVWVAVQAEVGPNLDIATVNLSIDFLRRPPAGDVRAVVRLLKVGRRLSVGDVVMYADGAADPVARASVTFAVPAPQAEPAPA